MLQQWKTLPNWCWITAGDMILDKIVGVVNDCFCRGYLLILGGGKKSNSV